MKQVATFLARYRNGEYGTVWRQLRELGDMVRRPEHIDEATAVAHETMRRVRTNVETVYRRLLGLGYEFEYPDEAFVPPSPHTQSALTEIEDKYGYLPLSLTAFYLEVGSVDFMQSERQLIQPDEPDWSTASELSILGAEDPLVVEPPSRAVESLRAEESPLYLAFAPDEFHKAYSSGGENYHVLLPNASADFRIQGMYGVDEYFVDYLRATFSFGGFRGKTRWIDQQDMDSGQKSPPRLSIIGGLTEGLLPF